MDPWILYLIPDNIAAVFAYMDETGDDCAYIVRGKQQREDWKLNYAKSFNFNGSAGEIRTLDLPGMNRML